MSQGHPPRPPVAVIGFGTSTTGSFDPAVSCHGGIERAPAELGSATDETLSRIMAKVEALIGDPEAVPGGEPLPDAPVELILTWDVATGEALVLWRIPYCATRRPR